MLNPIYHKMAKIAVDYSNKVKKGDRVFFVLYLDIYAGSAWLIILSLVGYTALTIPMAIIMVWLYNNTQSIGLM